MIKRSYELRRRLSAALYRRLARLKRFSEVLGTTRVPGYERLAASARRKLFPGIVKRGRVTIDVHGLKLDLPTHFLAAEYEPVTTRAFRSALARGGVVVDVGAHVGYFTCVAAQAVGERGVVHSVEPAPQNLTVLRQNIASNRLSNVVVHAVAATATDEARTLWIYEFSDNDSLYMPPSSNPLESVQVPARPLDTLIEPPVSLIKVDVEGAEVEALTGMAALLDQSPGATVIVEWNPACLEAAGTHPAELPRLMQALGLRDLSVLDDRAGMTHSLSSTLRQVENEALPVEWYVNLIGRA